MPVLYVSVKWNPTSHSFPPHASLNSAIAFCRSNVYRGIDRIVAEQALDDRAVRLDRVPPVPVPDERPVVERVRERLADVDVAEEVRRDPVAVQLPAADVGIGGGVDLKVEVEGQQRQLREAVVDRYAVQPLDLCLIRAEDVDEIGVSALELEAARPELGHGADHHPRQPGRCAPVLGVADQNHLLRLPVPLLQHERSRAVHVVERVPVLELRVVVALPRSPGCRPSHRAPRPTRAGGRTTTPR